MKKYFHSGFTISELSIATAFIAMLIIAILVVIMQSIDLYQKGLSIRAVSTTGTELIDEFTRTVNSSYSPSDADKSDFENLYYQATGKVTLKKAGGEVINNAPLWGFFCSGSYTYIWRTGYAVDAAAGGEYYAVEQQARTGEGVGNDEGADATDITLMQYHYGDDGGHGYNQTVGDSETKIYINDFNAVSLPSEVKRNFRLIRLYDPNKDICVNAFADASNTTGHNYNAGQRGIKSGKIYALNTVYQSAREFLSGSSEDVLAFYDFHIYKPTYHPLTGHTYFAGSFVLGTLRGSINISTVDDVCREKSDGLNTDFAYCAINKFNFAIRATGGS